jgi:hypothetical protein
LARPNQNSLVSKRSVQLAGLLLWRFGLIVAGTTGLYRVTRFLLTFFDLPLQLEVGAGLMVSGFVLVMVSLVMERMVDARSEGDLRR